MDLHTLGWKPFFAEHFAPFAQQGLHPARIACEHRTAYLAYGESGELSAEVAGRMRHQAIARSSFPAVGDWVAVQPRPEEGRATILGLLPRQSCFSRKVAGGLTEEQVLAANIDTAFLVSGLDHDFNLRRLERYLVLAWDSGANPVVVLNKADLCDDLGGCVAEVEQLAAGAPIHPVSAAARTGLEALLPYLGPGQTAVLLGSSGVGKSTLVNALLGTEQQQTSAVRPDDSRGRHTTTRRELILLPSGGLLIDSPGMRELQLWSGEENLGDTFEDVEGLAAQCRFRDCHHQGEPGCAIRQALDQGALDPGRFQSYLKLQRELRHLARQQDQATRLAEKAKGRQIRLWSRRRKKEEE